METLSTVYWVWLAHFSRKLDSVSVLTPHWVCNNIRTTKTTYENATLIYKNGFDPYWNLSLSLYIEVVSRSISRGQGCIITWDFFGLVPDLRGTWVKLAQDKCFKSWNWTWNWPRVRLEFDWNHFMTWFMNHFLLKNG